MTRTLLTALLGFWCASASFAETIVRLDNPAAVALILREEGFRAKLTTDDNDRPSIRTGIQGLHFSIKFYGCDNQIDCYGLLFTTWFDLKNGIDTQRINDWNADALLGRAFVDADCDAVIDHYILADTSRALEHFLEELDYWGEVISDFRDFVFDIDDESTRVVQCDGNDVL